MKADFLGRLSQQLKDLQREGLYHKEIVLASPQGSTVLLNDGHEVLNLCSNNYLGLANHPAVIEAAQAALETYGFGMASVRFICGTHAIHLELEQRLSHFLGTEATLLLSSCFDANEGLFAALLDQEDAILSDSLNHASIIDGVRLCKAHRYRFERGNLEDLESQLKKAAHHRYRLIATDGVFSMDGTFAELPAICDLADAYDALVMIDDCHATGFIGAKGKGSHEHHHVMGRIDLITSTLGKALGGATGGFASGRKELVDYLRQRSRPYLYSNAPSPVLAAASLRALDLLEQSAVLREQLHANTRFFRQGLESLGLELIPGSHPIVPILLYDARLAQTFAKRLLEEGILAVALAHPVVPQETARIRTQLCSLHTEAELTQALTVFEQVGKELQVL